MKHVFASHFILAVALLTPLGCSTTPCAPGQQISCACENGAEGVQVCVANGAGFDSCHCPDGTGGAGGGTTTSQTTSTAAGGGAGTTSTSTTQTDPCGVAPTCIDAAGDPAGGGGPIGNCPGNCCVRCCDGSILSGNENSGDLCIFWVSGGCNDDNGGAQRAEYNGSPVWTTPNSCPTAANCTMLCNDCTKKVTSTKESVPNICNFAANSQNLCGSNGGTKATFLGDDKISPCQ